MLKKLIYVMLLLFFINCKHEKLYKCAYVHIYNNSTGEELDLDLFVEINESFSQTTFIELSLPNGEIINASKIKKGYPYPEFDEDRTVSFTDNKNRDFYIALSKGKNLCSN